MRKPGIKLGGYLITGFPLFEQTQTYNAIYRWFDHLKHDGCQVLGYVLMPNHFHVLLYPTHAGTSPDKLVGPGKRFMVYDIVSALKKQGQTSVLKMLQDGVAKNEKMKEKIHQVFNPSFDARECYDLKMIEQKLDYIHHNPVRGKWSLVEDFTKYPHSSAAFYECEEKGRVEITHYNDLCKD